MKPAAALGRAAPTPPVDPRIEALTAWLPPHGRKSKVRLDLNENRFIDPSRLRALLDGLDPEVLTMYPEYDRLYGALAAYTGRSQGELLVANGADQGIELVLRAFCAKRKVVLPVPTFSYYQHVAGLCGIELLKVGHDASFGLSGDAVIEALEAGADGVVLVNPSNPLATVLDDASVVRIVSRAAELGAFVLIDEVYFEFCARTYAGLIDRYPNLMVLRSFSKGFGLAGIRLGYVIAAAPAIEQMRKLRGPWDVNGLAVGLATAALEDPHWFDFLPVFRAERRALERCLSAADLRWLPSAANFVVARATHAQRVVESLASHGVLVTDLSRYPDARGILENCIRIAVPNPQERGLVHAALRASSALSSNVSPIGRG